MKLIIAGDRNVKDIRIVKRALIKFIKEHPDFKITEIVSGGCRGVDLLGEEIAKQLKLPIKQFPYLAEFGKAGGPRRNQQMADYADGLCAVLAEGSRGTADMIKKAKAKNLVISIFNI